MIASPAPGPLSSVPTVSGSIPGLDLLNSTSKAEPSDGTEGSGKVSNMPEDDHEEAEKPEQVRVMFCVGCLGTVSCVGMFFERMFL